MRSILARLTIGLTLCLTTVYAVQWSAARGAIEAMMEDYVVAELQQDAEELSTAFFWNAERESSLAISHFDPVFLQADSGRYFQISAPDGRSLRSASLGNFTIDVGALAPGHSETRRKAGPQQQQLLVSARGYQRDGQQVTIAVAADMRPIRHRIESLLTRHTLLTLAMFALLVVLQAWIVRRALAPLRHVQSDVARLERGEITQLGESAPSEVLPLVRSVNGLLALLVERLRRSREALGNLSHALKTPLTLLTQMTDPASTGIEPALRAQMQEQLRVLATRIDRELRRARVAGLGLQGAAVDLIGEVDSLLLTMRKLHQDRHLDIAATVAADACFRGDREDLLELCGNLLDNACKWARHAVRLSVGAADGFLLSVEDDGPGCADADLERIAERGVRLDESTAGHGLGLAIVRNIVSSHGGEIRFGRSAAMGGLQVSIWIPDGSGIQRWPAPRADTPAAP